MWATQGLYKDIQIQTGIYGVIWVTEVGFCRGVQCLGFRVQCCFERPLKEGAIEKHTCYYEGSPHPKRRTDLLPFLGTVF